MTKKITLYMETTKKDPEETIADIQRVLKKYQISAVHTEFDKNGNVNGMAFILPIGNKNLPVKVPANWKPLWEMAQQGLTRYIRDENQARRVAWRQIFRWIEAQCALLDLKMVDIQEVFLPYIWNGKKTFYQQLVANNFEQLALPK